MQNINTYYSSSYVAITSSYAAINAIVAETRLCSRNEGGSDWFENHDDELIRQWFEFRIVHRNGVYAPSGEFIGECHELTKWSQSPIEEQINQLDSSLWLIEIYSFPKGGAVKVPDYVAVLGKPRQLYAVAFPLSTGRMLQGVVSTDGFWEVGRTGQGVVNLPLEKTRVHKQPTREQSAEMQSIAFHKLNNAGGSWNYYTAGETIEVEPVEGQLGTYYKYPTFSNRFGVGSAIVIRWELDIDPRSAEALLQSQMEELKYL